MAVARNSPDLVRLRLATAIAMAEEEAREAREAPPTVLGWLEKYAAVVSPIEGRLPFRAYPYQAKLLEDLSPRRIINKARQTGMSQIVALEALHLAVTRPDTTILFVSRNGDAARNLVAYCSAALPGMPAPPLKIENQTELAWTNGSRIMSLPANANTGRSIAATAVYLDEFARADYDDQIYQSMIGTVSTGGRMTILSTPNGRNNTFFRIWAGFEAGEWSRHSVHWSDCPLYDEPWAEQMRKGMTRQAFASEFDLDFTHSGDNAFEQADIDAAKEGHVPDPVGCDRYLTAWDIGRRQDHTVGITLGLRGDIWHVVEFERFMAPYPLIQKRIAERALQYGRTIVESNGVGDPVIENLIVHVEPYQTTARTKMQAIQALQLLLQKRRFKFGAGHEQLERELALYEHDDHHLIQDCVMAAAIAAAVAAPPAREGSIWFA